MDAAVTGPTSIPATVEVICGTLRGTYDVAKTKILYLSHLGSIREATPTEFERLGGRQATKKWKQSIRVVDSHGSAGKSLGEWLAGTAGTGAGTDAQRALVWASLAGDGRGGGWRNGDGPGPGPPPKPTPAQLREAFQLQLLDFVYGRIDNPGSGPAAAAADRRDDFAPALVGSHSYDLRKMYTLVKGLGGYAGVSSATNGWRRVAEGLELRPLNPGTVQACRCVYEQYLLRAERLEKAREAAGLPPGPPPGSGSASESEASQPRAGGGGGGGGRDGKDEGKGHGGGRHGEAAAAAARQSAAPSGRADGSMAPPRLAGTPSGPANGGSGRGAQATQGGQAGKDSRGGGGRGGGGGGAASGGGAGSVERHTSGPSNSISSIGGGGGGGGGVVQLKRGAGSHDVSGLTEASGRGGGGGRAINVSGFDGYQGLAVAAAAAAAQFRARGAGAAAVDGGTLRDRRLVGLEALLQGAGLQPSPNQRTTQFDNDGYGRGQNEQRGGTMYDQQNSSTSLLPSNIDDEHLLLAAGLRLQGPDGGGGGGRGSADGDAAGGSHKSTGMSLNLGLSLDGNLSGGGGGGLARSLSRPQSQLRAPLMLSGNAGGGGGGGGGRPATLDLSNPAPLSSRGSDMAARLALAGAGGSGDQAALVTLAGGAAAMGRNLPITLNRGGGGGGADGLASLVHPGWLSGSARVGGGAAAGPSDSMPALQLGGGGGGAGGGSGGGGAGRGLASLLDLRGGLREGLGLSQEDQVLANLLSEHFGNSSGSGLGLGLGLGGGGGGGGGGLVGLKRQLGDGGGGGGSGGPDKRPAL
ncbi:hypothetical protein HYH03_007919 [Edaphochlamys debaryana]|uniref:ARID domain-containing protein n=1 Tax=Edaphochlamys debaryana TaxID=47281 RepID=A0A836BZI9_9CHLO|nr:hypothetical protein HYH03_007919 [Edaphochlamys debaryana]|eukprot:KAG2493992.1 hypothetical protein HYH03_007919 [Edaphochlamys debaryana]